MGLFSLFGKKDGRQATPAADKNSARIKREDGNTHVNPNIELNRSQVVQRKAAQATALKIDAIESEMSSEFVRSVAGGDTLPPSPAKTAAKPDIELKPAPAKSAAPATPPAAPPGLGSPTMGTTTGFLLDGETINDNYVALTASEAAPAIEEAAILFANGQFDMVEQVLQAAISEDVLGHAAPTAWAMLFDLHQINGKRAEFDSLSIAYANKFETSPPAWIEAATESAPAQPASAGMTPTISLSGKLNGAITLQLEQAQKMAALNRVLRLEFVRISDVDPIGCAILLEELKRLHKSGNDLILVGALDLASKIRAILEVGRRDETEVPWLLLLEILRLLNLEKDFEEASIDYCVTFEVSPPAFVAPKNKVTTAPEETRLAESAPEHFTMPDVLEGRTDQLVQAIANYARDHDPAILDCRRLIRVDFNAAGQLAAGLAPFTLNRKIEAHNVNHLVAALFGVMGLSQILHILPRKN